MIQVPPYLKKGDCIGIVAPAGYMALEKMETCINTLQDWGYTVQLGNTTNSHSDNYFSGTDEERAADLQQMMDDKSIHAILCARVGYGMSRIIDDLSFKKFKKHPKWIIGFSDITVLHSHLFSRYGIASLHAPMAAAFTDGGGADGAAGGRGDVESVAAGDGAEGRARERKAGGDGGGPAGADESDGAGVLRGAGGSAGERCG